MHDDQESEEDENSWINVAPTYSPQDLPFTGVPGFKATNEPHETPIDIFKLFLTDNILNLLTYYFQTISHRHIPSIFDTFFYLDEKYTYS